MILSLPDVQTAFPGFTVDTQSSGYEGNDQAAEGSIDPADTGADLTALGRIDGYKVDFTDLADDLGASMSSLVDLFDSPESATASLQLQITDFKKFEGTDLEEGVNFKEFAEISAPAVGSDTIAGRFVVFVEAFDLSIVQTFVSWRRGPMTAAVLVVAFDTKDRSTIVSFLARQMDAQIDKALAGEIGVTPVPSPTPVAVLSPEQAALQQGYDLSKMFPALDDLVNAKVTNEGYQEDPNVVSSYRRSFHANEGVVLDLGSSKLINLVATVALQDSLGKATGFVSSQDPDDLGNQLAPLFGVASDSITMTPIADVSVGDTSAIFEMQIKAAVDLDGLVVVFARGRVTSIILAFGPSLLVGKDDLVTLAQLIDKEVTKNSPP